MADLCRAVGIVPRGGNYETLRRYGARLGLELPGQHACRTRFRERLHDDAFFAETVAGSVSVAEVIRRLDGRPSWTAYQNVRRRVADLQLDTSHFLGQASTRGRTFPERWKPLGETLRDTSSSPTIRRALIRSGAREHRCETCCREEWQGRPIPLELDHFDGDRTNNALDNLRLLCPNCHALTPTYRGRNIGRYGTAMQGPSARAPKRAGEPAPGTDPPTLPFPPG